MDLRAPKARPSVRCNAVQQPFELVRAMTYKMYRTLIASFSAVALMLAANEAFGGSGLPRGVSTHPTFRPFAGRPLHHHHRRDNAAVFWPGTDDFGYGYGPSNGEPMFDATQPRSGDIHYTYTYDVPWDAVHRFPQTAIPSQRVFARPYVPGGCTAQSVTVPGTDGKDQAVNIVRC